MEQYFIIYDRWEDFELNWIADYRVFSTYDEADEFKKSLMKDASYKRAIGPLIKAEEPIDKSK